MSMYEVEKVRDKKLVCMLGLCLEFYVNDFILYLKQLYSYYCFCFLVIKD